MCRCLETVIPCLNQASRVGPATRQAIAALFDAKPIIAQAYLPARNILGMAKGTGDNKMILEEACHRLIGSGPHPGRLPIPQSKT